tara:strand:- start:2904 stop:3821 length:918 start_codon:yes stop_codon:yes gene_type:complete
MKSKFKDWKCRCSSLGHILTNRPSFNKHDQKLLDAFEKEKKTGINTNGNKTKWTDSKETKLQTLLTKKNAPDSLPDGAKTHLDNIFRGVFWGRNRLLYNKYLDKGNLGEEDSLDLLSHVDGFFYSKNTEKFKNKWIIGTPDNTEGKIRDIKTNWDMESFEKAELTSLYTWQCKAYVWLLLGKLKNYKAELVYCLVNNPYHQLMQEKTGLYYKLGTPEEHENRWVDAISQLERNMIFDVSKWKEAYPGYDFYNTELNFSIPPHLRIKRFDITLNTQDIKFMKSRVTMAKKYLIEKEQEVLKKIKNK